MTVRRGGQPRSRPTIGRFTWLLGLCGLIFGLSAAHAADEAPSAAPLFAAALVDTHGKAATLEQFKGQPLVVNFWARWCGPCREEIPELIKAHHRFQGRGVEIVGVALEDKADAVREFAAAYGIDYPVVLARDKGVELIQALGNSKAGLPFTLALDRHGKVVYLKLGGMKKSDIEAAFDAALK